MASSDKTGKIGKTSHSSDLMRVTGAEASLRSKLLLSSKAPNRQKGPPMTFRIDKPSVLSRVKKFLPEMAEADKKLEEDLAANCDVNIEVVADDEPHIEMNLALVENDFGDEDSSMDDSCDSDDNSDDNVPTKYCGIQSVTEQNLKIHNNEQHKKPFIEELNRISCVNNNPSVDKGL